MIRNAIIFFTFLFILQPTIAQEKVCVPNVWKGEVIKGKVFLENGDSLTGKFTHLTPYNDIKTTHIIYKGNKSEKLEIFRKDITAYFNRKTNEYRIKVYVDSDSVFVKKNCFYDQGKFLLSIVEGKYTLLKDELNYHSTIAAYSQSTATAIYYILPPNGMLLKVQINDLNAQIGSLLYEEGISEFKNNEITSIDDMIEVLNYINSN